jgi:hypothetical protein
MKTDLKLLPSPSSRSDLTTTKRRIDWRKLFYGNDIISVDALIRTTKSPCRHAEEDVDAVVINLIFNRTAMEKTNPPCPLTVAGKEEEEEEEEEINP